MGTSSPSGPKTEQILSAVRTLLAQNGYAGTTISQVAAEADVSRGLLHYYFKNKEEMLVRVIQADMEASVKLMAALFAQSESASTLAKSLIASLRGILENDPDFFKLFFEAWAVARQNPMVDSMLKTLYGQFREAIHDGLENAAARGIIAPGIPLSGLAVLLTGIIDGLGLQLVTEPELIANEKIWNAAETGIRMLLEGNLL